MGDLRENRRMSKILPVLLAVALAIGGCAGGSSNPAASPVDTGAITMKDNAFQPAHVQVPARTTVTWTNGDQVPHDVSFDGGPKSAVLSFGATFQRVFDTPGTFDYECTIHPGMVGRVTVVAR
jgi:plastocyanin